MKVGMIGIGLMGHGIAGNIVKQGHELAMLEHPGNQPLDALKAAGAVSLRSAAELAARSDVVILVLTGSPQVEAVLTGPGGVAKGQRFVALAGLSRAERNISDWAGGMRRFAREEGQISRAEFKLLEALEVFRIVLPPRGVALDLGASPGGLTGVLRQLDQYVTAVDPGELGPRLAGQRLHPVAVEGVAGRGRPLPQPPSVSGRLPSLPP